MCSRCIFRYTALRLTPRLRATWLMLTCSCSSSRSSAGRRGLEGPVHPFAGGRRFGYVEPVARAQGDHGTQRVAQLSQVAGPALRAQCLDQRLAERDRRGVGRFLGEEMPDERAPVGALAESRQRQGEPLQAVEQVLAELLAPD